MYRFRTSDAQCSVLRGDVLNLWPNSQFLACLQYSKQTQLETLSSEKAAAVLQLEKESRRFQEYKVSTCDAGSLLILAVCQRHRLWDS